MLEINLIAEAVAPMKADAILHANRWATARIAYVLAELAAHDWDMDKAAPRPRSTSCGRFEYLAKQQKVRLFEAITQATWSTRRMDEPNTRRAEPSLEAKFIADAERSAAAQYDAFVSKLINKIGPVTAATLTGNHVWSFSELRVKTTAGEIQTWRTRMIVNTSKLGLLFNQWPSRKIKS